MKNREKSPWFFWSGSSQFKLFPSFSPYDILALTYNLFSTPFGHFIAGCLLVSHSLMHLWFSIQYTWYQVVMDDHPHPILDPTIHHIMGCRSSINSSLVILFFIGKVITGLASRLTCSLQTTASDSLRFKFTLKTANNVESIQRESWWGMFTRWFQKKVVNLWNGEVIKQNPKGHP